LFQTVSLFKNILGSLSKGGKNYKKIIKNYYNSVFPWLERCEKVFGFKSSSYGETRIYGFLAERYLSYWFNKYTKPLMWPIIFYDINSKNEN